MKNTTEEKSTEDLKKVGIEKKPEIPWQTSNAKLMVDSFNNMRLGMNIYPLHYYMFGESKPLEFGVNWSARGTQNVEDTDEFIESLSMSKILCKRLNDMKIQSDGWNRC